MGPVARVDIGDYAYHVINRAVGRLKIFDTSKDYALFLDLLAEAKQLTGMRILAFEIMPNHWHLLLHPRKDGGLCEFMHALTNAHTRKVHTITKTIGTGPLYQGRYKSFLIKDDAHLLTVLKYVERNAPRAKLVKTPQEWRWGSAWVRMHGTEKQKQLLDESPVPLPDNYEQWICEIDSPQELELIRGSVKRGAPFGDALWVEQMVVMHPLAGVSLFPSAPINAVILLLLSLLFLSYRWFYLRYVSRRIFAGLDLNTTNRFAIDDSGVENKYGNGSSKHTWKEITDIRHDQKILLLFISRYKFFMVPKRAVSDQDWEEIS